MFNSNKYVFISINIISMLSIENSWKEKKNNDVITMCDDCLISLGLWVTVMNTIDM